MYKYSGVQRDSDKRKWRQDDRLVSKKYRIILYVWQFYKTSMLVPKSMFMESYSNDLAAWYS